MLSLKQLLAKDNIFVGLQADTKQGIIVEMIDRLVANGKLKDRQVALKAILEREKKMSTGMQNGIAFPHCRSDAFQDFVVGIGIRKEGVDFESVDGLPCRIIVMTFSPDTRTGPHIQFLSEISRILDNAQVRDQLVQAKSAGEIVRFLHAPAPLPGPQPSRPDTPGT